MQGRWGVPAEEAPSQPFPRHRVFHAIDYQEVMTGSIAFIIVVGHEGEMPAIRTKVDEGRLIHGAEFVVGAIFRAIDNDIRSTSVMRDVSQPLTVGTECEVIAPNVSGRGVAHEVFLSIHHKYWPVLLICCKTHR